MIKVQIKKLDPNVEIPEYKTSGSSGVDLMANLSQNIIIKSGESCLVPTGLSISIPKDCEVQIRPRSGLAAKSQITVLNTPGTIDSDYRGELKIIIFNHGKEKFVIKNKDRIAQMVLMPILKFDFQEVDDLGDSVRGTGGFGSTGK